MKLAYLFLAASLFTFTACDNKPNQTDGVKDALDARPNEGLRDAGESMGEAVKDAGHEIKDGIKATGQEIKHAVEGE